MAILEVHDIHTYYGDAYVLQGLSLELQEGQIWESLGSAANRGYDEITAIVDHNKLQSDTFVQQVSDLGDLQAKFRAFGWHVVRVDGHDLAGIVAHVLPYEFQASIEPPLIATTKDVTDRRCRFGFGAAIGAMLANVPAMRS